VRILVVEDDADQAASVADFYESLGHEVRVATNGPHALRQVESFDPEIVLIDIVLPVFDGNLVAAEIRRRRTAPPRLFAMTGRRESVLSAMFDGFLAKPLKPEQLAQAVAA
jgi:CheY-like chemotaxis protein